MPSIEDEIDDQHGREEDGVEEVAGNEEAPQPSEESEDADVNLLNQEILTSPAFVHQAKVEKFVQVVRSNAWTREP